jgi:hypothetical protein
MLVMSHVCLRERAGSSAAALVEGLTLAQDSVCGRRGVPKPLATPSS